MRAPAGIAVALGALLTTAVTVACGEQRPNTGEEPPEQSFFFPSGLLLDPVDRSGVNAADPDAIVLPSVDLELPGRHFLYVANGNNDRTYNAGTLTTVDLRDFWRAWYQPGAVDPQAEATCVQARAEAEAALVQAQADRAAALEAGTDYDYAASEQKLVIDAAFAACEPRSLLEGGLDPYCGPERCVLPPASAVVVGQEGEPDRPCRRLPLLPHVVECDETPFVRGTVRVGDFATTLASSVEDDGAVRLWLPVRGDPSITYVDVQVSEDGALTLDCDQNSADAASDPNLCGDSHRLDRLRNDGDLDPLDREPFNMAIWESDQPADPEARGRRLGFVAHADGSQLSMIDLDGVRGQTEPALVDLTDLYVSSAGVAGGFGLAVRPCFGAGQGPLGAADPEPNIPAITQGCRRPLVYSSFRFAGQLASFTASGLDLGEEFAADHPPGERVDCMVTEAGREIYAGQYCATPDQLGQPCAVECEPQVRGSRRILPSLLLDSSLTTAAVLGDMAFADPRGDQLLILQTNPGALLSLDTSLGDDGEPLDIPSAPPLEICAEPSRMKIFVERAPDGTPVHRYALITCFRAALVYVVDLEALRVVDAVVVGTGPHDIAIDQARQAAYVINSLESSVSVIDLSRRRPTRFQELARLGLQDPFSQ